MNKAMEHVLKVGWVMVGAAFAYIFSDPLCVLMGAAVGVLEAILYRLCQHTKRSRK